MEAETQSDGWRGKIARDEEGWIESEGGNEERWKVDIMGKRDWRIREAMWEKIKEIGRLREKGEETVKRGGGDGGEKRVKRGVTWWNDVRLNK